MRYLEVEMICVSFCMQTEWRSQRLVRNAAELAGRKWSEAEVQTDPPDEGRPVGAQTDREVFTDSGNQTDESPFTQLAIDFHVVRLKTESLDHIGCQLWVEIIIGTEDRMLAAGRTQAEVLSETGVVEWNARLSLHTPAHLRGKMKQQITVWAIHPVKLKTPEKVCDSSRLLRTTHQVSYLEMDPSAELVIAPITASLLA